MPTWCLQRACSEWLRRKFQGADGRTRALLRQELGLAHLLHLALLVPLQKPQAGRTSEGDPIEGTASNFL